MLQIRDIYMAQHKPDEIEFGHVCETPDDWEQRFEKINLQDKQHQGKVSYCLKDLLTFYTPFAVLI